MHYRHHETHCAAHTDRLRYIQYVICSPSRVSRSPLERVGRARSRQPVSRDQWPALDGNGCWRKPSPARECRPCAPDGVNDGNDPRITELLRALVAKDAEMRRDCRNPSFLLMQASSSRPALRPGIGMNVTEADIADLIELSYLRELPSNSPGVRVKFIVTGAGRAASRQSPTGLARGHGGSVFLFAA